MPQTHSEHVLPISNRAQFLAGKMKALEEEIQTFIETNSDLAIDWANATKPAVINEDANGNIDGTTGPAFDRTSLSNFIFSAQQYLNLMGNVAVTQGDHRGTVNKLAPTDAEL